MLYVLLLRICCTMLYVLCVCLQQILYHLNVVPNIPILWYFSEGQQMCMDTTEGVFNNNNKCVWIRQRDFSITSDYLMIIPLVLLELQHTAYNLYCTRCHIQVLEYIWNTLYRQLISNTTRLSLPTFQGFFN